MITLLWWLFPPKIFPNTFMRLKKQDTSKSLYHLCDKNWKLMCWKLNSVIVFGKKEQTNHCRVLVEKKQYWNYVSNTRSNNPPCIQITYYEHWHRLTFWIKGSTLATIQSQVNLIKIKITNSQNSCFVDCSLINKIKWTMKITRGPGIQYQ